MNEYSDKIRRNDYCPCGSGLKYKKCHLLKPDELLPQNVPLPVLRELKIKKIKSQDEEKNRKKLYGEVRPIISCDTNSEKLVAIGSKIFKTANWADFHGFLLEHVMHLIDEDWIKSELSRDKESKNTLCKWYDDTFCNIEEAEKRGSTKSKYSFRPLLSLAYDLFVLSDHMSLQTRIINRLQHHEQFSSARYELFVAATCIRAGFTLNYENEDDRRSRHVEFQATHNKTGETFSVEAKRSGTIRHNYGKLINDALGKAGNEPLIVFIDVNLSPQVASDYLTLDNPKLKLMLSSHIRKSRDGKDLYNLLVFTNHPYRYATDENPNPERYSLIFEASAPLIVPKNRMIIGILNKSVMQYGNIPKDFPKDD